MKNLFLLTIALLIGFSSPVFAAVNNDKSASYVKDAEEYLKKGDVNAAIIQLKNAIVAEPKNPLNRIALANLYLRVRNAPSAEKEYLRALDLGVAEPELIIGLSKARLLQRKYQKVVDTLHEADVPEKKKGEAYLIIGNAHQGLGNLDKALEYFQKGEKANGQNSELAVAIAQIHYFKKDLKGAEKKVDEALNLNPKNVKGIILKGELVNLKDGPEKSLSYFEQALEYDPKNISALFKLSAILVDLKRPDEALEKLGLIYAVAPKHPLANYLSAVIYAQKSQFDKAEEYLDSSGQVLDNFPGALFLRGVINYSKQNYAQAIYSLNKLINLQPKNIVARRLLGASLLRQNDAEQAVKILLPAVAEDQSDSVIYALLGSAYMKLGNFEKGTTYFEKAVENNPNEEKLKTQLALSNLASGDVKAAQMNLQKILDKDPNSKQAAVFMTLIYLKEKQYDKAISSADNVIKQSSVNPVGYNLKGTAYREQKKFDQARVQFEKALEVSPLYYSASMNLAGLDILQGDEQSALPIYHKILKTDEKYTPALLALARHYKAAEDDAAAEKYYEQVIDSAPENMRVRIEYSDFFVGQKKLDRAKAIIQQMIVDFPDQAAGYEASGNINLMMGNTAAAVGDFDRMSAILVDNPSAYQLLGRAQLSNKDVGAARKTYLKALSLAKNKIPLLIELASLETMEGEYTTALTYSTQIKDIDGKNPVSYVLEGRVYSAQKKNKDALQSYIKAAELGATGSRFTVEISRAYINVKQADKALSLLNTWLDKNKNDIAVRHILASYYLQASQYKKAVEQYEIILKQDSKNPIALNNISWLYSQLGENKKAIDTAEKSYNLFPEEAAFIDTYAWILVQQGQNSKGLKLLQQAVLVGPKMMEVRYHLAVALNNAGKKILAKKELETVIASGENFADMGEAKALLTKLSQ